MNKATQVERRSFRSPDPATALGIQLESTRSRGRLEAVVLTDQQGIVLAASGEDQLCVALGALAPLAPYTKSPACMSELVGHADVAVRSLRSNGSQLFLAAVGGTAARDAVLAHAAVGVERILLTN